MNEEWDVFISHASEDKKEIVRDLANLLASMGVRVWYDEFTLTVGDSLIDSINSGLKKSRFGIVIISKYFLEKKWPDYELKSLLTKEKKGVKSILPIRHNVTQEEIQNHSLYLSDIYALDTRSPLNQIALDICEIIRPDVYIRVRFRQMYEQSLDDSKILYVDASKVVARDTPIHKISGSLLIRIKNVYYGVGQFLSTSVDMNVSDFERDLFPEREIQVMELMNLCYLEFIHKNDIVDVVIKKSIAWALLGFSFGTTDESYYQQCTLTVSELLELHYLWRENSYKI